MPPTAPTLTIVLPDSKYICWPKTFFAPVSGLSFLKLGLSGLADGAQLDLRDVHDQAGDHAHRGDRRR